MVKIALIGTGAISGIYLENLTEVFKAVEIVGVCDLIPERAQLASAFIRGQQEKGLNCPTPKVYKDMHQAFNDPEVSVILNLTRPYEHYEVTKAALNAGKHVYAEKPLAVDMEEAVLQQDAYLRARQVFVRFLAIDWHKHDIAAHVACGR